MTTTEIKLRPLNVPNFIIPELPPGQVESRTGTGFNFKPSDLSPEILGELCDNFRRDLFEKAGKDDPEKKD